MKQVTLNPEEEKDYELLRKMGQKLHVPIPEAKWKLEVFLGGNLIQSYEARCHSWVRNTYNAIFCGIAAKNASDVTYEAGKLSLKDTAAAIKSGAEPILLHAVNLDTPQAASGILATAAVITHGIMVGSGVNAEDFEDYVLQTPIAEGAGVGQLNAIASELHSMSYAALTLSDEQIRYFNNNSGGNVSVNEVAIGTVFEGPAGCYCLLSRDKLGATVTVPDTGQLKVTYTISLVYPS